MYGYDGRGNRRTRTVWAANDGANPTNIHQTVEEWRYDLDDRLVEHERPLGGTTTSTFDDYGRLATVTQPSGRVETRGYWNSGPVHTQTYTQPGQAAMVVERFFDSQGRRTEMTDGTGTSQRAYDPTGRIVSFTVPAQVAGTQNTYEYTYDLTGNATRQDTATGAVFTYTHTEMDQLDLVSGTIGASSWPIATHAYDPAGHLTDVGLIGGIVGSRSWTYPANGSPHPEAYDQELLVGYPPEAIHTDMDWNPQGRLDDETTNGITREYTYDPAGQLLSRVELDGPQVHYTYGPRGERLSRSGDNPGDDTIYTYDDDARLVGSAADGQAARTYGYDLDGRRTLTSTTAAELQLLSYDQRGLLSGVRNGDASAPVEAREHDGDGVLVNYTSPGAALDIVWDPTLDIPQISDVRVGTNGTVLIARASQVISFGYFQDGEQLGGGVYTYDAHGSYIDNTNWPAPTDYSPYGEPVDLPAGSPVQGAYRGEMTISGLLHLRNRDYDPVTGSFTTPDPLDGIDGTPTVGNPYHYGDNDPTNRVDPLGLSPTDNEGPNCEDGQVAVGQYDCVDLASAGVPTAGLPWWAIPGIGVGVTGIADLGLTLCLAHPILCLIGAVAVGVGGAFAYDHFTNDTTGPGSATAVVPKPGRPSQTTTPSTTLVPPPIVDLPDNDDDCHAPQAGCGNQVVSYRGVDGNPGCQSGLSLGPSAFRLDPDGVSTFERPHQGALKPCLVPFAFPVPNRAPGATGPVAGLPACTATHTPSFGTGHWSINCAGDTRQILSTYSKGLRDAGRIEENELYGD